MAMHSALFSHGANPSANNVRDGPSTTPFASIRNSPDSGADSGVASHASPVSTLALDPSIAKQMAAISQYSQARSALSTNTLSARPIANGALSGTTANNSGFSGQMTSSNDSISSNQAQHNQDDMQNVAKQKMRSWYSSLAQFMVNRGTPLPPGIVGVPWPQGYDPNTSPFKAIEAGAEPGSFRIAGKDIGLFKFWSTLMSAGGANKITQMNGWPNVLQVLELPTETPNPPNPGAMTPVLPLLVRHYHLLLQPFTEWWLRNLQDSQRKAMAARQQQQNSSAADAASTAAAASSSTPAPNTDTSSTAAATTSESAPASSASQPAPEVSTTTKAETPNPDADADARDLKRKNEEEEKSESKRARTESNPPEPKPPGSEESSSPRNAMRSSSTFGTKTESTAATMPASIRKIEYLPLAREIDTYGGRNIQVIETELHKATRRPLRDHNDWGSIDIDHLILNIRSRIPTELSYALTTLTLLSTMRGQTAGSGFPIHNCGELFDEVLDLIEDEAFGEDPDVEDGENEVYSKHYLAKTFQEAQSAPFAVLNTNNQPRTAKGGPRQSAAALIKAVMNIVRNLSVIADNQAWLGKHKRMLGVVLRVSSIRRGKDGTPQASSSHLSLGDVLVMRKDALNILSNVAPQVALTHVSPTVVRRAFKLISSYLIDPVEAVPPIRCVYLSGIPPHLPSAPTKLPDLALEAFTRLGGPDINRQVFARFVTERQLWQLIEALVHRLPIDDDDFQLGTREVWLSYIEKTVFSLYSLFFLSPPSLKKKVREDKQLAVVKVMQRMVTKFMLASNEARQWYHVCAKRTIETLKILDDGEDSFTTPTSTVSSVLSFGIGYGEGETTAEKGTGLWAGAWDATWELLMLRDLDGETFGELDSLLRVEVASAA